MSSALREPTGDQLQQLCGFYGRQLSFRQKSFSVPGSTVFRMNLPPTGEPEPNPNPDPATANSLNSVSKAVCSSQIMGGVACTVSPPSKGQRSAKRSLWGLQDKQTIFCSCVFTRSPRGLRFGYVYGERRSATTFLDEVPDIEFLRCLCGTSKMCFPESNPEVCQPVS